LRIVPAGTVVIQTQGGVEFAGGKLEAAARSWIRLSEPVPMRLMIGRLSWGQSTMYGPTTAVAVRKPNTA